MHDLKRRARTLRRPGEPHAHALDRAAAELGYPSYAAARRAACTLTTRRVTGARVRPVQEVPLTGLDAGASLAVARALLPRSGSAFWVTAQACAAAHVLSVSADLGEAARLLADRPLPSEGAPAPEAGERAPGPAGAAWLCLDPCSAAQVAANLRRAALGAGAPEAASGAGHAGFDRRAWAGVTVQGDRRPLRAAAVALRARGVPVR